MASGPSDITAISACLPGARLPMRSAMPSIAAPRVVIQSSASAAGTVEVGGNAAAPGALRRVVEGALRGERHARHGEHVAADRRFEIDADRRRRAQRAQPAGDGMAVALRHLVLRRDREAHAEIDEGLQLGVGEVVAVHDVDVRADQAVLPSGSPSRPASWPRRRPGAWRRPGRAPWPARNRGR